MNNNHTYSYTVLRYVHDTTTGEFINVGVVIYAPDIKFIKILCRNTYGRLNRAFPGMKAEHFKFMMRDMQTKFSKLNDKIGVELPWQSYKSVLDIVRLVLPTDDSTMQWSPAGIGRTPDPEKALLNLFDRMVMRYEERTSNDKRTEDDVWRHFKHTLEAKQLIQHFEPKKISADDDEIEFHHTWQNGVLHCLEPISFDLSSPDSIRDKAHRWLGRVTSVANSPEKFRVYFLVGEPQEQSLFKAYNSALSILQKIPVDKLIFKEQEVDRLYNVIAEEMAAHEREVRC